MYKKLNFYIVYKLKKHSNYKKTFFIEHRPNTNFQKQDTFKNIDKIV